MLYYKSRHIVHTVYDYKVFILLFCVSVYSLLLRFENPHLKLFWQKCHFLIIHNLFQLMLINKVKFKVCNFINLYIYLK